MSESLKKRGKNYYATGLSLDLKTLEMLEELVNAKDYDPGKVKREGATEKIRKEWKRHFGEKKSS